MPFCSNCGRQIGQEKFCPDCGTSLSQASAPPLQTQQLSSTQPVQPNGHSDQGVLIGIHKELDAGEKIQYQTTTFAQVIFVKEAEIKKVVGRERKEVPISISNSLAYLTDKRLVFLKLFEISATEMGEDQNLLAGATGTFYEVPLKSISSVDMRPVKLNKNDEKRFIEFFGGDEKQLRRPALELIYDEKAATGRAKDYMESMIRRGVISKLWGKVEMVYDKIFVLGEQSVAMQPLLTEFVRNKTANV